jgi:MFS family permease
VPGEGTDPRASARGRIRRVIANPDLRRIQLSLFVLVVAGSGYQVALAVVAFRAGGAQAVGIAFSVQVIPVALATPFTSVLADRFPRRRVMVGIDLLRAAGCAAVAAALAADGSLALVLLLGAPGALFSGAYAPASRALLPSLVSDPEELTSANAVLSGVEHSSVLAGPALFGALLTVADVAWVFAAGSVLFLCSAVLVARVRGAPDRELRSWEAGDWRHEATAGLRAVWSDPNLRLLVGIYGAQWLVGGALEVLVVVMARHLTGLGESGIGVLFAALGAGGLAGTIVAGGLAGRRRLTGPLAAGVVLWGLPLVLIGLAPHTSTALAGLAVIGLATVLVDVSIVTLLQRTVDEDILGRVFGVLESALLGMVAVGAIAAPLLIDVLGTDGALVAAGGILPLLIAVVWRRLRRIDIPSDDELQRVAMLQRLDVFQHLPAHVVGSLADSLSPVDLADGHTVIRQGEPGDRFYVVAEGTVEVRVDDAVVTLHHDGEGFGEIALLRNVPRTATVTARGPVRLYALDRDVFLSAVARYPVTAAAGNAVATARLERRRPAALVSMS